MYIKLPDIYPYRISRFRAENPGTSFPETLSDAHYAEYGIYPVTPSVKPVYDPLTQELDESAELVGSEWVQVWTIRPATNEEAQEAKDSAAKESARLDGTIRYLVNHTPAEIASKVDTDVTNLAAAKTYISRLAVAVSVLAKKELR